MIPLWRIHRTIGMGGDKLVAEVAGDEVEERLATHCATPGARSTSRSRPRSPHFPGHAELVRALARSYRVALASSGDPEFADEALDDLDIRDDVAVLKTSDDVDGSKPEPDLIEVTLESLGSPSGGARRGHAVRRRVGRACRAAGASACAPAGTARPSSTEAGAVLVVDVPEDLVDLDWEEYLSSEGAA